jgi:hypothetical protein
MFVAKAGTYYSGATFVHSRYRISYKYKAWLRRLSMGKHASLFLR